MPNIEGMAPGAPASPGAGPRAPNAFGIQILDLPVDREAPGTTVDFTFFWPEAGHWENSDFSFRIEPAA